MVMFKAKFRPMAPDDKPSASAGQRAPRQQQQQPQPGDKDQEKAPPIEKEQGPQVPIKLPGQPHEPERAR